MGKNDELETLSEDDKEFLKKSLKKTLSATGRSMINQIETKGSVNRSTLDLARAAIKGLSLLM